MMPLEPEVTRPQVSPGTRLAFNRIPVYNSGESLGPLGPLVVTCYGASSVNFL